MIRILDRFEVKDDDNICPHCKHMETHSDDEFPCNQCVHNVNHQ